MGFGGNRGKVGIWCLYLGDWGYGVRILLLNFDVCSREGSDGVTVYSAKGGVGFQSTLPRGERRLPPITYTQCRSISIHAPARGATQQESSYNPGIYISIHAPARGATRLPYNAHDFFKDFNPRSREGSDGEGCRIKAKPGISIHAPARGATAPPVISQSTLFDFNPRSREGSDSGYQPQIPRSIISIHAPARGATISSLFHKCDFTISIHAPARGATYHLKRGGIDINISIHAPARGATTYP